MSRLNQTFSITLSIALGACVLFYAATTSAGNPASPNPLNFPSNNQPTNNTPFLVTVGAYTQTKGVGAPDMTDGGGLAVAGFLASANASFDKEVGVQGILFGKPTVGSDVSNSNLSFGAGTNKVTVQTTGWTYARNGALYTPGQRAAQPGTAMPLCADNDGQIITCPNETPIIIP